MAAETGVRRGCTWMTGGTCHGRVLSVCQREGVPESRRLPCRRGMTGGAVRSCLARMRVLCLMARVAILGRAHKVTVDVTTRTRRVYMRSGQGEG